MDLDLLSGRMEAFSDGKSPAFKVPTLKCSNPGDAKNFADSHSLAGTDKCYNPYIWGKEKCPVHCAELKNEPWVNWAKARELYATTEDEEARPYYLQAMLSQVSDTSPPNKDPDPVFWMTTESTGKPRVTKTKTKTWHDIDGQPHNYEAERLNKIFIVLSLTLAVWTALAVIGLISLI